MKKQSILKAFLLTLAASFVLYSCESTSLTGPKAESDNYSVSYKNDKTKNKAKDLVNYPIYSEHRVDWIKPAKGFDGCSIKLDDGTKLKIDSLALKAPKGTKKRKGVLITVEIDTVHTVNGTELVFTFGPHGSRFKHPARIELDWAALGVNVADLYYLLEDGTYELQQPDQIDIKNKKMILYVNHFSRYAVAYGR